MLKSIKLFASFFLLLSMLFSCKKENVNLPEELKIIIINVSLETGKIYNLDINAYTNPNDIIVIAKQANTFEESKIEKNELKNIYIFKRNSNQKEGANKESVVLKIYEPRNGVHCEKTEILINFTII
jgi:hypothetical protein